jgi:glycosyltransferase involved in cell wall biosynthesis
MSVYNGDQFLRQAVESILNQTFTDFEFIITDDGSTDGTWSILTSYDDSRIHLAHNEENVGLTKSLNKGLAVARGRYIARMDADDVSLPERLAKQVRFLDTTPSVGVLGSWIEYIDEDGTPLGTWQMATSPHVVRWGLMFGTCLAHPAVIMRQKIIQRAGSYRDDTAYAQDYGLWVRASAITQIANLREILLQRRRREGSISENHHSEQEHTVLRVVRAAIGQITGLRPSEQSIASLRQTLRGRPTETPCQARSAAALVRRLHRAYVKSTNLRYAEAREIRRDAASKLCSIAQSPAAVSGGISFSILLSALVLHPHPDTLRSVVRGVVPRGTDHV